MNVISAILLFAVMVMAYCAPEKYSDKYDNVDIDSILKNDRVLTSYVNCILEKGPCTQEGRDFKKHLPEAISTNCDKCTSGQKKIVRKAAKHLMNKKKPQWEEIRKKYDPKGEHYDNFVKFMNSA